MAREFLNLFDRRSCHRQPRTKRVAVRVPDMPFDPGILKNRMEPGACIEGCTLVSCVSRRDDGLRFGGEAAPPCRGKIGSLGTFELHRAGLQMAGSTEAIWPLAHGLYADEPLVQGRRSGPGVREVAGRAGRSYFGRATTDKDNLLVVADEALLLRFPGGQGLDTTSEDTSSLLRSSFTANSRSRALPSRRASTRASNS